MVITEDNELTLYVWYRSSCAARVRLALAHKQISYRPIGVNYHDKQHHGDEYAKMNPSKSVPTLVVQAAGRNPEYIAQSLAAIEYLEEAYPDAPTLLPPKHDLLQRAKVRSLAHIIALDLQPVTNSRVVERLRDIGTDHLAWSQYFEVRAMGAYENSIRESAGKYSVGDNVTMADICLAPAVWNCENHGVTLDHFPTVQRVYRNLMDLDVFKKGQYNAQPDCPGEERLGV